MASMQYPPIALLSQVFDYKGGSLYWKERPCTHFVDERAWKIWNTKNAGNEAGCPHFDARCNNYRWMVKLSGKTFYRSVLVYALHTGTWPTSEVDHIDRNTENDWFENLRLATSSQNQANATKHSNNSSGFKGVTWDKCNRKWLAVICVNGKRIHLGRFDDPEDGHKAYCAAALKYFGTFACTE